MAHLRRSPFCLLAFPALTLRLRSGPAGWASRYKTTGCKRREVMAHLWCSKIFETRMATSPFGKLRARSRRYKGGPPRRAAPTTANQDGHLEVSATRTRCRASRHKPSGPPQTGGPARAGVKKPSATQPRMEALSRLGAGERTRSRSLDCTRDDKLDGRRSRLLGMRGGAVADGLFCEHGLLADAVGDFGEFALVGTDCRQVFYLADQV